MTVFTIPVYGQTWEENFRKHFGKRRKSGNFLPFHNVFYFFCPKTNEKSLAWSKLKAFVDSRSKMVEIGDFVHDRVENIFGNKENADY